MTISSNDFLEGQYLADRALGDRAMVSDARMVIDGLPQFSTIIKSFPTPFIAPAEMAPYFLPLGQENFQASQKSPVNRGSMGIYETAAGHAQALIEAIASRGGEGVSGWIYDGTPDAFSRALQFRKLIITEPNAERDMEQRGQVLVINCSISFLFFGKVRIGTLSPVAGSLLSSPGFNAVFNAVRGAL